MSTVLAVMTKLHIISDIVLYISDTKPNLLAKEVHWFSTDSVEIPDLNYDIIVVTQDWLPIIKTQKPILLTQLFEKTINWCKSNNYHLYTVGDIIVALQEQLVPYEPWQQYYTLGQHYRLLGKNLEAYNILQQAKQYCHDSTKVYQIYQELTIVTYYTSHTAEGLEYGERVVLDPYTPQSVRDSSLLNQAYYMLPLTGSRRLLQIAHPSGYYNSNASILATEDGYRCAIRCVDYIKDTSPTIANSLTLLVQLNSSLQPVSLISLVDDTDVPKYKVRCRGIEDLRLFGNNEFLCTYPQTTEACMCRMWYGQYTITDNLGRITTLQHLVTPADELLLASNKPLPTEKNWLPYNYEGKTYFIYSLHPLIVYTYDSKENKLLLHCNKTLSKKYLNGFRGSGTPIPYKGGMLLTIHQLAIEPSATYFHRFVWLDYELTTLKYSRPFYFETQGVEYTIGHSHSPNGLVLCYSVKDNKTTILTVPYAVVDSYLELQ